MFLGYPAQEFVLVTLSTLTKLAAATLVDIPSQVNLLLDYMRNDTRRQVKLESLKHLYHLAKPGAHLWPPKALEDLIDYILDINDTRLLTSGLREYAGYYKILSTVQFISTDIHFTQNLGRKYFSY